jgi:hypothetical protein
MAPRKEGVQDPRPIAATEAEDAIEAAPDPSANSKTAKKVQVLFPHGPFVMEDVPVVTNEGTSLTKEQLEKFLPVAKASGVRVAVDGEEV